MRASLILCLPLVAGCARLGRDEIDGIHVQSAELDDVEIASFGALVGFAEGSGDLVVVDQGGNAFTFPVTLGGGMVGLVVDMGGSIDATNRTPLELPEDPITADELLGVYTGSGEDAMLGLGVQSWQLRNKAGVRVEHGWVSAGFGVMADLSWLRIRIGHGHGGDTGAPPEDTAAPPPDTSDTAPTPPPDTGRAPVETPPPSTTDASSGGCGDGGGCHGGCGGGGCCEDSCSTTGTALILLPFWRSRMRRRSA